MTDNTLDTQLNEITETGAASPTTRPTASSSRMT